MDAEALLVAVALVITAIGTVVGPVLLSYLNGRQLHRTKLQDYARQDAVADRLTARQDAVAAQAAEAAELLLAAQRESITRADEVARLAAEAARSTARKLEAIEVQGGTIHQLVNRKLTDVTEHALLATQALLPYLRAEVDRNPTRESRQRLADTERAVVDLQGTLVTRAENQARVDQASEPSDALDNTVKDR